MGIIIKKKHLVRVAEHLRYPDTFNHTTMRILLVIILAAFCVIATKAQSITQDLRRDIAGQGTIIVNHSAEIESLVNAVPKEEVKTPANKTSGNTTTNKQASSATSNTAAKTTAKSTTAANSSHMPKDTQMTDATADISVKNTTHRGYKTTGYRIQIYSGGNKRADRTKCEQIAAQVRRSFPELPVYINFHSPSWKCRAGNFTDYSEAQAVLKQVKAMGYSQACLVKGTIVVR